MIYLIQALLDNLDAKFKTSIGYLTLWIVLLLIGSVIGFTAGYRHLKIEFEKEAIHEGVGLYVCDGKTGNCKFTFIPPVRLKPITGN